MPCEMVSLAFDANLFATKLKERVKHEGLKKQQICRKIKVMLRDGKMVGLGDSTGVDGQHDEAQFFIFYFLNASTILTV